jgi:hypothetical protein
MADHRTHGTVLVICSGGSGDLFAPIVSRPFRPGNGLAAKLDGRDEWRHLQNPDFCVHLVDIMSGAKRIWPESGCNRCSILGSHERVGRNEHVVSRGPVG